MKQVRISDEAYDLIVYVAEKYHASVEDMLTEAVDEYYHDDKREMQEKDR